MLYAKVENKSTMSFLDTTAGVQSSTMFHFAETHFSCNIDDNIFTSTQRKHMLAKRSVANYLRQP